MSAFFQSMAYPFLACLLLAGILGYLGIHVLARKVIFVDLALAQIAALGAVSGALLGWDLHDDPWVVKAFSLAFALLGAVVFTLTRMRDERVPHEALIGIAFAVATGATILAASHLAHGAEEVSELQAGSILWVRADTIVTTVLVFAAIGLFHWVFRRQFFRISLDPQGAERAGMSVRLWDFLFYVSLGFAVTNAIAIAGVLLVFSYLVIPSVVGMLFARGISGRLAIAWAVGTLVSAAGVALSYFRDLPSGPAIVVTFGVFLVLVGAAHYLAHAPSRPRAALQIVGGAAALGLLVAAAPLVRKRSELDLAHLLEAGTKAERIQVLAQVSSAPERWAEIAPQCAGLLSSADIEVRLNLLDLVASQHRKELLPAVQRLLMDQDDALREAALKCVRALEDPSSVEALLAAARQEVDEYLRVELAEGLIELGDRRGVPLLLDVMEGGAARQARKDAWEHLDAHATPTLPFHPEADNEVAALRTWWERENPPLHR